MFFCSFFYVLFSLIVIVIDIHSLPLSHIHTHIHKHTHTRKNTCAHTHTHPRILSLFLPATRTNRLSLTLFPSLFLSHTHTTTLPQHLHPGFYNTIIVPGAVAVENNDTDKLTPHLFFLSLFNSKPHVECLPCRAGKFKQINYSSRYYYKFCHYYC